MTEFSEISDMLYRVSKIVQLFHIFLSFKHNQTNYHITLLTQGTNLYHVYSYLVGGTPPSCGVYHCDLRSLTCGFQIVTLY